MPQTSRQINLPGSGQGFHLPKVCPSSWVSWACYSVGLFLALTPAAANDLAQGGTGFTVLGGAIFMFFLSAAAIQRHMRLSLLSSTYGTPKRLVTSGVFGVSRNPIYVAFLLPLLSLGYYSAIAALVASVLYVLTMTRFIILREEEQLHEMFGAEYAAFAESTPRWIGV